jgi:hypothetical protein
MKKALIFGAVALVSFLVGAGAAWLLKPSPKATIPSGWIAVKPRESGPLLFDTTALNGDIPFPDWPKGTSPLSGQVKFLERTNGIVIGYELSIHIDPNPVAKLPAKYRQPVFTESGIKLNPAEQVAYSGKFTFDLQDADGFSFLKVKSGNEHIDSGAVNQLKGMTTDTVSEEIVKKIKKIVVDYDAEKCDQII